MSFVNKIYEQYASQQITKEEAASLLLGEIFKSPRYYHLKNLTEDDTSDFLIWIHKFLPRILDYYKHQDCTFLTYFTTTVRLRYRSWKRQSVKEKFLEKAIDEYSQQEYSFAYQRDEQFLGESKAAYSKITPRKCTSLSSRQMLTLLILTLKSVHLISPKALDTIPELTGIPSEKLQEYAQQVMLHLQKKKRQLEIIDTKLNKAYILTRQYSLELANLDETSYQYIAVQKRLAVQQRVLEKCRDRRKKYITCLKPSNKLINEILGISERTLYRILADTEQQLSAIRKLLDP